MEAVVHRRGRPGAGTRVPPVIIAAIVALVAPAAARAHARGPAFALDYRATVMPRPAPGVWASVLDGNRKLKLVVAPAVEVVVLGSLGEPVVRLARDRISVNERSPTALVDGLAKPGGRPGARSGKPAWLRVGSGRSFAWHDHRIAPRLPPGIRRARWSIPIVVHGRPARLKGEIVRVRRPSIWPWLALAIGSVAIGAAVATLRRFALSVRAGVAASVVAAAAGLVSVASFSLAGVSSSVAGWAEVAAVCALAAAGAAGLVLAKRRRLAIAGVIGALAAGEGLGRAGVFKHGVVISALPATAVRVADAVAIGAGLAATLIAVAQPSRRYQAAGPRKR